MEVDGTVKCPIWGNEASLIDSPSGISHSGVSCYDSPRAGGQFGIDRTAEALLGRLDLDGKVDLTTWLVQQRRAGITHPLITEDVVRHANNIRRYCVSERIDNLLLWLDSVTTLGQPIIIKNDFGLLTYLQNARARTLLLEKNTMLATAHSMSRVDSETMELLSFLVEEKLVSHSASVNTAVRSGGRYSLTWLGYQKVETLKSKAALGTQAFVAMWFDKQMDAAYSDGFKAAIEDAGYLAMRIDNKEHNNKIDDEILAEIRRSKFVVADFTSDILRRGEKSSFEYDLAIARGGVYFEAGFAKGLGKEVIWTVREDVLPLVHFDTRQFAHIVWKDAADLRSKLAKRIAATMDYGPLMKPSKIMTGNI